MKSATTYKKQYEILVSRGLICKSERKVISFLKENSYYRFSGYAKLYMNAETNEFVPSISFEKLFRIYQFDSEMRSVLNSMTAQIEIAVRTQLAYNLSNQINPYCYKNKSNFVDETFFKKTQRRIKEEIRRASEEPMVKRYAGEQIPFWVIIEIVSFGVVSKLYANLLPPLKKSVSSGTYFAINYNYFENYLNVCTSLRNNCAHRARLYGRFFTTAPKYSKKEKLLYGDSSNTDNFFIGSGSSASLFETIFTCMKLILRKADKEKYINAFSKLIRKYRESIELEKIGFPNNWETILYS